LTHPLQAAGIVAAVGATGLAPENAPALPEEIAAIEGTAAATGLGDLTVGEVEAIQGVVDEAGRVLNVVGSAANAAWRGSVRIFRLEKVLELRATSTT
jgi:hypothetical protein